MMKPYWSANGHWDPKQANGNDSEQLALSPQVLIFPPPRQDSPVPSLPCKQTLRQPTPGPSGTRWSEELFPEPSQIKEPPIPGLSPSFQPPEDNTTHEPEPEVAPTQSMEEPFAFPATPHSIIIIDDTPGSLPVPPRTPMQSPSHSHNEACQEFTDLRPTLMIP
ncbi:hypothetical protein O181_122054 [Austropuccinia psidii MF-1]|uniref:Uncharacterized protein n=1 Tax=Austropuccinia psidii MF-1 TaxID=1389203 RepID=A0A9Q3KM91_9BASI|nr:hypothetical protein [Austropuccinia psidii MF-1]